MFLDSVAAQLEKLKDFREKVKNDYQIYITNHPELKTLIGGFVSAVIAQKPNDIVKFGSFYFSNLRSTSEYAHCPVVISGPSSVGEKTLINMLVNKFPYFGFSVSHTTRAKREDEVDGLNYNFVSKLAMEEEIENGAFIEYAKKQNFLYSTSYKAVEKVFIFIFE